MDEVHVLDEVVTVTTSDAHFREELRLYDSTGATGHDSIAIIESTKVINSVTLNVGNNAATLKVYGSVDGETWVLIQDLTTAKAYTDFTVNCADAGYKYLKLDAVGAQVRVKTMTLEFVA